MRLNYIIIIALVVTGFFAADYLLPTAKEIAIMKLDGVGMIESQADYETQLTVGNLAPEVVFPLVRIYLENNELNRAIALLEAYLSKNPEDIRALDRISTLYQYAGRQKDYAKTLERISALRSDPENLKKLSDIYNYNQDYIKQVEVLEKLLKTEPGKTENYTKLAFIYRQMGRNEDAANTMKLLFQRNPEAMDKEGMESWVIALSQVGRDDDAFAIANNWLATQSGDDRQESTLQLVNLFYASRRPDLSLLLLQPYREVKNNPDISIALVRAELANGKDNEAFARMSQMYKESRLPESLRELFLDVAIRKRNEELIAKFVTPEEVRTFPEFRVIQLIDYYAEKQNEDGIKALRENVGAERLAKMPVLDALFGLALREESSRGKAEALLGQQRNVYQTVALSRASLAAGLTDISRDYLYSLRPYTQVEDQDLGALTWLMLQHKATEEGFQTFESFRASRPSNLVDVAWVKMAAAVGLQQPVATWLNTRADDVVSPQLLRDIYYIANDYNHPEIALHAAKRLYWRTAEDTDQYLYASSLLKNNQQTLALEHIQELKANGYPIDANLDTSLLYIAAEKDPSVRPQLIAMLEEELRQPTVTEERKLAIIQRLFDYNAADSYAPLIKAKGLENRSSQWYFLYEEMLRRKGDRKALTELRRDVATGPNATRNEKRQYAYDTLSQGNKKDAAALFAELAETAKPGDKDLEQLLYLWGVRPEEDKLNWMAARAARAQGDERTGWLKILHRSGGFKQLVEMVEKMPPSARTRTEDELYFESLQVLGNSVSSEADLERMIAGTQEYKRLETLRSIALANNYPQLSDRALEKMIAIRPTDQALLKEKALSLYNRANYTEALPALKRYHSKGGTDFRTFYYAGEILTKNGLASDALPYYQRALVGAQSVKPADMESDLISAQSLYKLGRMPEAREMMARVVAANPHNKNLNADYLLMLLSSKQYNEARRFIEATEDAAFDAERPQPPLNLRPQSGLKPASHKTLVTFRPMAATIQGISLPRQNVVAVRGTQVPHEMVIQFSGPASGQPLVKILKQRAPVWLNLTAVSYDSIVVVADNGIRLTSDFAATSGAKNFTLSGVLPEKKQQPRAKMQKASFSLGNTEGELRMQLLRAQLDLETGHQSRARDRLEELNERFPNNPQVLAALASVEWYMGHTTRARRHISESLILSPNNEDAMRLRDSINEARRGFVKADGEVQVIDDDTMVIGQLHSETRVDGRNAVGVIADHNYVMADGVQRGERGNVEDKEALLTRQELYWRNDLDNGDQIKLSGYYNMDSFGAGAEYLLRYFKGDIGLVAEYHRPNWDFVEGVLDRATRDRVAYWQNIRLRPDIAPWFMVGYNRYNTEFEEDVSRSFSLTGNVRLPLYYLGQNIDRRLFAEYGLDAEYRTDAERGRNNLNVSYLLYPLVTREVHYATLGWRQELYSPFIDPSYWEVFGGYAYDRFGGNGPYVGGRWVQQIDVNTEFQLRFSHSIAFKESDADSTRVGGYLKYKFQ